MARKKRAVLPQPSFITSTQVTPQGTKQSIVEVIYFVEEKGVAVRHSLRWIEEEVVKREVRCELDGKPILTGSGTYMFDDDDPGG